jgi:hypothetical protein
MHAHAHAAESTLTARSSGTESGNHPCRWRARTTSSTIRSSWPRATLTAASSLVHMATRSVCGSGPESAMAVAVAAGSGYENVSSMMGAAVRLCTRLLRLVDLVASGKRYNWMGPLRWLRSHPPSLRARHTYLDVRVGRYAALAKTQAACAVYVDPQHARQLCILDLFSAPRPPPPRL